MNEVEFSGNVAGGPGGRGVDRSGLCAHRGGGFRGGRRSGRAVAAGRRAVLAAVDPAADPPRVRRRARPHRPAAGRPTLAGPPIGPCFFDGLFDGLLTVMVND